MKAPLFDLTGKQLSDVDLPDAVFGIEPHRGVMHQALVRQLANARRGTAKAKTRGEVSRTTKKWFRQKGTGRARHGSRSANLFVGGGIAHGPRPRSYTQSMPRKMRRLALRSALSVKAAASAVALVDNLALESPKTRVFKDLVEQAFGGASTLILLAGRNDNVERSIRNLPHVRYLKAGYLNVRDLLGYDQLLIEANALPGIVQHLTPANAETSNASV